MMRGIDPRTLPALDPAMDIHTLPFWAGWRPTSRQHIEHRMGTTDIPTIAHALPIDAIQRLPPSAWLWLRLGHTSPAHSSVEAWQAHIPAYAWFDSLRAQAYDPISGPMPWTAMATCWNGLRAISMGQGFACMIDHAPIHNPHGRSVHHGTHLDGQTGIMVYWKTRHILTIGVTILHDGSIALAQVQASQPHKNRWMYTIRTGLLHHTIAALHHACPNHPIYIIDGAAQVAYIRSRYTQAIHTLEHHGHIEAARAIQARRDHLDQETDRIVGFYSETHYPQDHTDQRTVANVPYTRLLLPHTG